MRYILCQGLNDQFYLSFDDQYSEWCDYLLENSNFSEISQLPAEEDRPIVFGNLDYSNGYGKPASVCVFPEPGAVFELSFSRYVKGRMKSMLISLARDSSGSIFSRCVKGGLDPKQTYKIKQLIDNSPDPALARGTLNKTTDINKVVSIAKNSDMFYEFLSSPSFANSISNGSLIDICAADIDEMFFPMIKDALTEGVDPDDILYYADRLLPLWNTYCEGVPVKDIFN